MRSIRTLVVKTKRNEVGASPRSRRISGEVQCIRLGKLGI